MNKNLLVEDFQNSLLEGVQGNQEMRIELSEPHVYSAFLSYCYIGILFNPSIVEKGGFWKPHKVTPEEGSPLGSIIVIYQTAHKGGGFVLRRDRNIKLVDTSYERTLDKIQYIGVLNNCQLEVKPIETGYLITLTYHLYTLNPFIPRSLGFSLPASYSSVAALKRVLSIILEDSSFMEQGGSLGFGLFNAYHISLIHDLEDLKSCLVGRDAVILKACESLSLPVSLQVKYRGPFGATFLSRSVWGTYVEDLYLTTCALEKHPGSVTWVRDENRLNIVKSVHMPPNKAVSLGLEGSISLIVDIGPPEDRGAERGSD